MVSRSVEEFADKRADFQCWLWIVMLDHWDFVNVLCSFLTIYALLCSNVVVHHSDHNRVMVAQVDYHSGSANGRPRIRKCCISWIQRSRTEWYDGVQWLLWCNVQSIREGNPSRRPWWFHVEQWEFSYLRLTENNVLDSRFKFSTSSTCSQEKECAQIKHVRLSN